MNRPPSRSFLAPFTKAFQEGRKGLAWLIDPDKTKVSDWSAEVLHAIRDHIDYLFLGGSLLEHYRFEELSRHFREALDKPVVLFPGSSLHVHPGADAILFLSLISGRNPELLIGRQIEAAPLVRQAGMEVLPTGYMLIEGGRTTSAHYMSQTAPLPHDKPQIAACTAMAGELLGLKALYLDAGSGAYQAVSPEMVAAVRQAVSLPLIVGGGIRSSTQAAALYAAGANVIVVGSALEDTPAMLEELGNWRVALKSS